MTSVSPLYPVSTKEYGNEEMIDNVRMLYTEQNEKCIHCVFLFLRVIKF